MTERDVFEAALELSPENRDAYLDGVCGTDGALRQRLAALLSKHDQAGSFLEKPAVAVLAAPPEPAVRERPGTMIGPYKLLEQIGEGGFGVVFLAEQIQPLHRNVALKVLKPGMDTRQVVARFEAERQALALMDHPNIAHVFDGGETASGRPYFVMELVRGIPITDFCDHNHLPVRQRLELFVSVCQAVQHAHQKGIIHRDLKPTNVLVTLHDDKAVVKVIDFGIAKATGQQLTDKTLFTNFEQMIGTPLYMSPEQAQMSGLDVDTRTDVYALGVMLYELLTGTTPFDKERLRAASYDEIRRIIREEEPARPSTRISTPGREATLSAGRQTDPHDLRRQCRKELDWIVMKCLEKDRNRRYETVASLAADVRRYLADEPVQACPPSAWYRFRKFTRRNRAALTMTALVLLILITLAGSVGWVVRDRAARQAKIASDLEAALEDAQRFRRGGELPRAQAAAKRAEALLDDGVVEPDLAERVQSLLRELAEEEADGRLVSLLQEMRLRQAAVDVKENRFRITRARPDYEQAFRSYGLRWETTTAEEAAARLLSRPGRVRATLVAALDHWLILARHEKGPEADWLERVLAEADPDSWRQRLRAARTQDDRKGLEQLAAEVDPVTQPPEALYVLQRALRQRRAYAAAVALLRRAQQVYPADFWVNHDLGMALQEVRPPQYADAIRYLTAAVALRPDSSGVWLNLGLALRRKGRLDEAAVAFDRAVALDDGYARAHYNRGLVLIAQGRLEEAITACRRAVELMPQWALARYDLGNALSQKGLLTEAIAEYRRAIELEPDYAEAYCNLGSALRQQGELVQARAAFEQGHTRGVQRPNWPYPSAQWVQESRRLVELEGRLTAILRGEIKPANAAEQCEFARLCYAKQHYRAAARFWADAFTADTKLADDLKSGRRDEAICAAARAAAGQGTDAGQLDSKDRSHWRKQALQWLREDLAACAQLLKSRKPEDWHLVRGRLWNWQCGYELASLRDPAALAQLPADERSECRQLWAEVESVLKKMIPAP
jgi:serine/threonine protein kinase/tetratricopeptide (TPR) repeat protein